MPLIGKFRERTLRSFPRTMTSNAIFPFADRTRPTSADESKVTEYCPAGRRFLPQWTSNGSVNLTATVWAFAAAANAQVASRTTANSLTLNVCRNVLAFTFILLEHWPTRSCSQGRSLHRAFTQ